jgi:uncharacterized membrane protein
MTTHSTLPDADDFARMEHELFDRLETGHTRKVRKHRLIAAASIVLMAGGGVAAATVVDQRAETHQAFCYGAASTADNPAQVTTPDSRTPGGAGIRAESTDYVDSAVQNCLALWQADYFSTGKIGSSTDFAVPDLQACLRNDLVIAVFPRINSEASPAAFCSALGLSAPPTRR